MFTGKEMLKLLSRDCLTSHYSIVSDVKNRLTLTFQNEKMMSFGNILGIFNKYQTKYYHGSAKKSEVSFSIYLQVDKKSIM